MLVEFSTQIVSDLNNHADLISLLDVSSVSALISEEEDGDSFVNYFIKYNGDFSKDANSDDWQVVIESWSDTYAKSIAIADQVVKALDASVNRYHYLTADSEPIRTETQKTVVVTKQIFNIKQ